MDLPLGPHTPALDAPHFPDRAHAVVWRNWTLVEPDRLATVLGTSTQNVLELARSMGLPEGRQVSPRWLERGTMTLLRRNWHLMPYEQLLELLDMSVEELSFYLREDDVAFIKLGNTKPQCEPVRYRAPDGTARAGAARIKHIVVRHFGDLSRHEEQVRFGFVDQWDRTDPPAPTRHAPPRIDDSPRFVYSYFGVFGDPLSDAASDPYPDGLLSELADMGVNGVWMHVVLRQIAPGGAHFPEFGEGHERRLENLNRMVKRARRHGIGIYIYLNEPRAMPNAFFQKHPEAKGVSDGDFAAMCTSCPKVRQWLSDAVEHVFRQVPDLAGVFTITASENLTFCFSHGRGDQCPRCGPRGDDEVTADANAVIEAGAHRANPHAKVFVWDWGWKGHGDAPHIIERLPNDTWLLSVSEWSLPIERGGVSSRVGEHAVSAVGPGPRARRHWSLARQRGLKTVASVHVNISCEMMSLPFLPVMDLVAQHAVNLAGERVDGVMLSWSMGGYPSPNLRVFQTLSQQPDAGVDGVLNDIACERYGARSVEDTRRGWSAFSRAFEQYPYHLNVIYFAPHSMGPANLLYDRPTGYRATMVGIPYDDLEHWRGPYPPNVLAAQFELVAEGWAAGLQHFERAVAAADESRRATAMSDLNVARAAGLHFESTARQVRFIMARDRLQAGGSANTDDDALRRELTTIIDREIELAKGLYDLALSDARIGFEASCHYFYVPMDLVEKVLNCEDIRQRHVS